MGIFLLTILGLIIVAIVFGFFIISVALKSGSNNYQQTNRPPQPGAPFVNQSFSQQQCGSMTRPDNYMVWSILATVLCCLPLGIVSIVYSGKVNDYWEQGRSVEAKEASDKAKMWAMIAAGGGLLSSMIGFFILIAFS